MKIKINTKTDTIIAVDKMLKATVVMEPFSDFMKKKEKAHVSILRDIHDKIAAKTKTILREGIENNRKATLGLQYHEAVLLENYVQKNELFPLNDYHHALLNALAHQLNQKLA